MKYFIQDFKDGSINFPYIIVEKELFEVSEIVRLSGWLTIMAQLKFTSA